jgi:hypothetical protein
VIFALSLGLILSSPRVLAVWQTGAFYDSDDAMRMVQVRALLAGQSWFDLTAYRLDPPHGVFMHWSRVVDVPIAVLIEFFQILLPIETAERLARLVFPLALQAALYFGIVRLARLLVGSGAIVPAIILVLLSGMVFGQFQPGRIDHHAPQIVLLVFMLGSMVEGLDPLRARQAGVAAILAALSLSISIENLPFIFVISGSLVLFWAWQGASLRKALLYFGSGFGLALLFCSAAVIVPRHWFDRTCDALSFVHFEVGLVGAAACVGLALLPPVLSRVGRFVCVGLVAIFVIAIIIRPQFECWRDPFTGIDPLVREIWLSNVHEALPLLRFWHEEPASAAVYAMPVLLGVSAMAFAVGRNRGLSATRWSLVAMTALSGFALSLWLIRVFGSVQPIALLGGVWCVGRLQAALTRTRLRSAAALSLIFVLPYSSLAWALALMDENSAQTSETACLAPSAFAPFLTLSPGTIVAPIDAGSHLLAHTPFSVLAAPYHRNNHGNRLALDLFIAEPVEAEKLMRESGAIYLTVCSGLGETRVLGRLAPHGLAAELEQGRVPYWLVPLQVTGTPYKLFALAPTNR